MTLLSYCDSLAIQPTQEAAATFLSTRLLPLVYEITWLTVGTALAKNARMKHAGGAEPVAESILAYLLESPEAEDSVDGIVEWWVMRQRIRFETARVKRALSKLVEQGLILQRRAAGTPVRYRLNKEKLREIKRLLRKGTSGRKKE